MIPAESSRRFKICRFLDWLCKIFASTALVRGLQELQKAGQMPDLFSVLLFAI